MNNVLFYKRFKEQIRIDLTSQIGEAHKEQSIAALNSELQPHLKTGGANMASVLASAEPEEFN